MAVLNPSFSSGLLKNKVVDDRGISLVFKYCSMITIKPYNIIIELDEIMQIFGLSGEITKFGSVI